MTTILITLALAWVALAGLIWLFQEKLMFIPSRRMDATPENVGLAFDALTLSVDGGETIAGWFVPTDRERRGTLLFCHGNAGNISGRVDSVRMFADLGLDVLIFDYEGYGESTGKPGEVALHRDAMAAWTYLIEERAVPAREIVVFGRSLGGGPAAGLAARVDCAGLILESTFSSLPDLARQLYPWLAIRALVRHKFDSRARLAEIDRPLLVVHSPGDDVIPYSHGKALFEAGREPKTFLELTGDHNNGFIDSGRTYTDGMNDWLRGVLTP